MAASWMLAAVLAAAAVAKLSAPEESRRALATFGVRGAGPQRAPLGAIAALERAPPARAAPGAPPAAAWGAAALLGAFPAVIPLALARGRAGAPCACFGARSRLTRAAVARDAA